MKVSTGTVPYHQVVVDTNVLLSAGLLPRGVPAMVVDRILKHGRLVFTPATFAELETRIWQPKFDRYLSIEMRGRLLHDFAAGAVWVEVPPALAAQSYSRDPDDDAFVRAALAAKTSRLVSGDEDLLVLQNVDFVQIISPRAALDEMGQSHASTSE